jgi:hypothetical protein
VHLWPRLSRSREGLAAESSNHCRNVRRVYKRGSKNCNAANMELAMNRTPFIAAFVLASILPITARAETVASTAIPDGTYTVKVVKVVDSKHVDVVLDNGQEATLPAGRSYLDFSKIQANDQLKLSLIGGSVMVYVDLTAH